MLWHPLPISAQANTRPGQARLLLQPPRTWIDAAAVNQQQILEDNATTAVRYRTHKIDARGAVVREVIESREGTVARLLERDGQRLTAEENQAELDRLNDILKEPDRFLSRRQRDHAARSYAEELIRAMPVAMIWSYAPQQPQPADAHGLQIVLDFTPDPAYKPPSLITEGLKGIAGRVWIDAQSRCTTRVEGGVLKPVDFGWGGMLARVAAGGTVSFAQTEVAPQRWLYSRLSEHLTIREVFVHTGHEDQDLSTDEVKVLPAPISYKDAIATLLTIPVPTR